MRFMPIKPIRNTKRRLLNRISARRSASAFHERLLPNRVGYHRARRHIARYRFAASVIPRIEESVVLDLGCGVGYGSNILARKAKHVVGVDNSAEAINIAKTKYAKRKNLQFIKADATERLPFADNHFDAVSCIETFEHFKDATRALNEIRRALKPNGVAIITTPAKELVSPFRKRPRNPYHAREFMLDEMLSLLRKNFEEVEIYGQQVLNSRKALIAKKLFSFLGLERYNLFRKVFLGKGSEKVVKVNDEKRQKPVVLVAVCKKPKKALK